MAPLNHMASFGLPLSFPGMPQSPQPDWKHQNTNDGGTGLDPAAGAVHRQQDAEASAYGGPCIHGLAQPVLELPGGPHWPAAGVARIDGRQGLSVRSHL